MAYTSINLSLQPPGAFTPPITRLSLNMTPEIVPLEQVTRNSIGLESDICWTELFDPAVIVRGYPIPHRSKSQRGLEISLELMAGLANADYLTRFAGIPVLKGFSAIFVMTNLAGNSAQWHFLFDPQNERITYLSALHHCPRDLSLDQNSLTTSTVERHFVGWTSSVNRLAGSKDYHYDDIEWIRLPHSPPGFALHKVQVGIGQYITPGVQIGVGGRNKRFVDMGPRTYHESIRSARKIIRVNMFDVTDRRGWLLDGASALLLLSRTQLSHPYSSISGNSTLDYSNFQYISSDGGTDAAMQALLNSTNQDIVLDESSHEEVTETREFAGTIKIETIKIVKKFRFIDLVKRNADPLFMLHDYQNMLMETDGIDLRFTDREKLEGWDFLELVGGERSLKPRFKHLKASGRGWVDFTREIRTVTLFASRLGKLFEASQSGTKHCSYWAQVPIEKDYLTVCVSTLAEICRKHGDSEATPFKLAHNVYWHQADLLYGQCRCAPGKTTCDRVQVLLPALSTRKIRPDPFSQSNGAVIFGRSSAFTWTFPSLAREMPVEGSTEDDSSRGIPVSDSSPSSNVGTGMASSTLDIPQGSNISSSRTSDTSALQSGVSNPLSPTRSRSIFGKLKRAVGPKGKSSDIQLSQV